jgi:hypothetical protein
MRPTRISRWITPLETNGAAGGFTASVRLRTEPATIELCDFGGWELKEGCGEVRSWSPEATRSSPPSRRLLYRREPGQPAYR